MFKKGYYYKFKNLIINNIFIKEAVLVKWFIHQHIKYLEFKTKINGEWRLMYLKEDDFLNNEKKFREYKIRKLLNDR